jgi:hypothetical protein
MLFAEVDWLHDKKDEYSLALPDGVHLIHLLLFTAVLPLHGADRR